MDTALPMLNGGRRPTTSHHVGKALAQGTTSDRLWGVQDVADYLGIPHKTLYNWRTRGIGPRARRVGRYLRYAEHLPAVLDHAATEQLSLTAALERLLALEVQATEARRLAGRLRFAWLPTPATLEDSTTTPNPPPTGH
jgi:hypothetical protein